MRIRGQILRTDGSTRIKPGVVVIEQGRIDRIEPAETPPTPEDLGGEDCFIFPGLVDTHVHLPQFDVIGADGFELLDWLERFVFPSETRWADAEFAEAMVRRVLTQMAGFGTTAFAAFGSCHHDATQRAIQTAGEMGFRAAIGRSIADQNIPQSQLSDPARVIDELRSLESVGRASPSIAPRFSPACSKDLLSALGDLARETGWLVQSHLAETRPEMAFVSRTHPGRSYVSTYADAGLLDGPAVMAHGIWLDSADRAVLAAHGTVIAHCPTANVFLDAGRMDLGALGASGVRVSVGSDVAGGPDRSMVRVGRAMIETAKGRASASIPTPADAWTAITRGNADALGWSASGRIEPGADADVVIAQPDIIWRDAPDPFGALLYGWDDRWIERTIIQGKSVWPPAG